MYRYDLPWSCMKRGGNRGYRKVSYIMKNEKYLFPTFTV
jgi:hypothetical protein